MYTWRYKVSKVVVTQKCWCAHSPGSRMVYSRLGEKVLDNTSLRNGLAAESRNPCTLT